MNKLEYFFYKISYFWRVLKTFNKIHPYDYMYIYEAEKFQIEEMLHYFRLDSEEYTLRIVKELELAKYLLDIITDEEAIETIDFKTHTVTPLKKVNWKNASRFIDSKTIPVLLKNINWGTGDLYKAKCEALYYKLRKYYMTNWWV